MLIGLCNPLLMKMNLPLYPQIQIISEQNRSLHRQANRNQKIRNLWEHFDAKLSERTSNQTSLASAIIMVKQYNDEEYLDRKDDPIAYWEKRKLIMPVLYKLAMKYLCIPATSVP